MEAGCVHEATWPKSAALLIQDLSGPPLAHGTRTAFRPMAPVPPLAPWHPYRLSPHGTRTALRCACRYCDVLPFDANRVQLAPGAAAAPAPRYINASTVGDPAAPAGSPPLYLVAQVRSRP